MFSKFLAFIRNFFTSAKNDPVSTGKGLVQLAGAGATVYGMATGKVPVNELSVGTATALTASGLHAIGSDNTGISPAVAEAVQVIETAGAVASQALAIKGQINQIKSQINDAQAVIDAASAGIVDLATIVPLGTEEKK